MDRRITFQEEVQTINPNFNVKGPVTWQNVATVYARVNVRSGKETYDADQLTAVQMVSMFIRYRTGLNERMRVLYEGRYYKIQAIVEPVGFRKKLLEVKTELMPEE